MVYRLRGVSLLGCDALSYALLGLATLRYARLRFVHPFGNVVELFTQNLCNPFGFLDVLGHHALHNAHLIIHRLRVVALHV